MSNPTTNQTHARTGADKTTLYHCWGLECQKYEEIEEKEIVDLHLSLESIIISRSSHDSRRRSCHGNEYCSTAYSVTLHSCEIGITQKLLWTSKSSFFLFILFFFSFHGNTKRDINHDCYMSACTPFSQPITLIQCPYARGADLYGKLCDLRSVLLLHSVWTATILPSFFFSPRPPLPPRNAKHGIVYFSSDPEGSLLQRSSDQSMPDNLFLLYVTCRSPGETPVNMSCKNVDRLGRQPRGRLLYFCQSFILDFVR